MTTTSTDIFLDTLPSGTEGCLVIDPDTPASTEVIFYNSKGTGKVTVPSVALGRGYDGSTAGTHLTGTKVIMAPISDDFRYIRTLATTTPQGYTPLAAAPNTVTANGNRSYTLVFNGADYTSTISPGMRLRTTRTVAAPTQCTSLNGTTQFYNKTTPAGMTFTNGFVVMAWIKLTSYAACTIVSRYNGTSGWRLRLGAGGQVVIDGFNAGAANVKNITSYQSVPLNKWVHVAAQLDMATGTNAPTTNYIMLDGQDVAGSINSGGTAPTALIQAGNLEIGSDNGGANPFPGKIAQAAVFSAKVTEATILSYISQGLAGTETSLASAYSFNNSINDLNTTNANNLSANGSAVATNADSPFGGQAGGTISSTLDHAIIQTAAFSTNTTVVVQVAEGCTIPTSGGVSAASYATVRVPYGFPAQIEKWTISCIAYADTGSVTVTGGVVTQVPQLTLNVPIGEWRVIEQFSGTGGSAGGSIVYRWFVNTAASATSPIPLFLNRYAVGAAATDLNGFFNRSASLSLSVATVYNTYFVNDGGTAPVNYRIFNNALADIGSLSALNSYL